MHFDVPALFASNEFRQSTVVRASGAYEESKQIELVSVLIDLTYYKEPQLVSAALGLLVRQFEQRKVLDWVGHFLYLAFDEPESGGRPSTSRTTGSARA